MKIKFLNYNTNSQLKKNKSVRLSTPYRKVTTIGVLFCVEDKTKHDHVKEFIKKLELDGKQVKVMSYLPNHKDNYEFLFDFFTHKDISFFGGLESSPALKFTDTPFDYLYCLDIEPNPFILNLLARSKAKCRIGKYINNGKNYFEMMIDAVPTTKNLIEGIYKYSTQLK